jgi:hypothetical protein
MAEQYLRLGSVVIDRSRNVPLRVVDVDHRPAGEHPQVDVDDPMARQWGVTAEDTVYDCVFLPTGEDAVTAPKKSYAYPESRLTRFPVEAALPEDPRRIHTQIIVEFLAAIFEYTQRADEKLGADSDFSWTDTVADAVVAIDFEAEVPPEVLLEEAAELAEASIGPGGNDDE